MKIVWEKTTISSDDILETPYQYQLIAIWKNHVNALADKYHYPRSKKHSYAAYGWMCNKHLRRIQYFKAFKMIERGL